MAAVWGEWIAGLRIVRQDRLLTGVFIMGGIAMINEGVLLSLLVPFVKDVLGGSAAQLGWLMSAQAIGGIVGGLLIGRIGGLMSPLRLIALCGMLDGILLLGIINGGSIALALVLIAIAGVPVVGFFVSAQTLVQQQAEDRSQRRHPDDLPGECVGWIREPTDGMEQGNAGRIVGHRLAATFFDHVKAVLTQQRGRRAR